jgi:chemotaxis protein methyltransferase CheR
VSEGALRAVADRVTERSGIVLPATRLPAVAAALRRIDPGLTADAVAAGGGPAGLVDRLVDELAIREGFFLRNADELATIDWPALAAAAHRGRRPLRVWSAGCANGEEPYTLALLAAEALGSAAGLDVLATDVARPALAEAEAAAYGERALAPVDAARRERWFRPAPGGAVVGDELRAAVRLARHNLARDPVPPAGEDPFDVVVCRNVLIYFDRALARRVLARMRGAVHPHGAVVVGTIDRLSDVQLGAPPAAGPSPAPPAAVPDPTADAALRDGLRALADGDDATAVRALRRALYLDPSLSRAEQALDEARARLRSHSARDPE